MYFCEVSPVFCFFAGFVNEKVHSRMYFCEVSPLFYAHLLLFTQHSTDKTIIVWELQDTDHGDMGDGVVPVAGVPRKCLKGHSHFVEDVVISSDSQYALSASWDKELRLWDIKSGATTRRFVGHTKDVLSCAFSAENRQIVSGSRDTTVKLWNTLVS